jgi:hypothetical protein
VKQDPQNRSYPHPRRKARKRHTKKHPKPSPHSTPVTVAERAQIKETQQLTDHPPTPLTITMKSVNNHKKKRTQGSPPTPKKKVKHTQHTETHWQQSTIHPPYHFTIESFYRWYAEQGCPTINPDYSWTPIVPKAREETKVTLSSESDSDSSYSNDFDSAKARDTAPPNARIGTATTQIVHSMEACYIEHEAPKRIEIQHRR